MKLIDASVLFFGNFDKFYDQDLKVYLRSKKVLWYKSVVGRSLGVP